MKATIFLLVLTVVFGNSKSQEDALNVEELEEIADIINSTLNKVIDALEDPLTVDQIHMNFSQMENMTIINGAFNLSKLRVSGVKSIVATKIHSFLTSVNITMSISDIIVNFKYWADMLIGEIIPFYGQGRNNIDLEDMQMEIYARAQIFGGIRLKDVKIQLHIGSITFDFNGILNNPELSALVNTILNDNFGKFINAHSELISKVLSPMVENVINSILEKL